VAATGRADRLAAADEDCLGRAAPLQSREFAVDELAVDEEAHEPMIAADRDTFVVATGAAQAPAWTALAVVNPFQIARRSSQTNGGPDEETTRRRDEETTRRRDDQTKN